MNLGNDDPDLAQKPNCVVGGGLHRGWHDRQQQILIGESGDQRFRGRGHLGHQQGIHQVAGAVGGKRERAGNRGDHLLLREVLDERREHQVRARVKRSSGGGSRQRVERGDGIGQLSSAHEERELSIDESGPLRIAVRVAVGIAAVHDGESCLHLRWVRQAGVGGSAGRHQRRRSMWQHAGRARR